VGREGIRVSQRCQITEEDQLASLVQSSQPIEEQSPEQPGQHLHGQEEARAAVLPELAIGR